MFVRCSSILDVNSFLTTPTCAYPVFMLPQLASTTRTSPAPNYVTYSHPDGGLHARLLLPMPSAPALTKSKRATSSTRGELHRLVARQNSGPPIHRRAFYTTIYLTEEMCRAAEARHSPRMRHLIGPYTLEALAIYDNSCGLLRKMEGGVCSMQIDQDAVNFADKWWRQHAHARRVPMRPPPRTPVGRRGTTVDLCATFMGILGDDAKGVRACFSWLLETGRIVTAGREWCDLVGILRTEPRHHRLCYRL